MSGRKKQEASWKALGTQLKFPAKWMTVLVCILLGAALGASGLMRYRMEEKRSGGLLYAVEDGMLLTPASVEWMREQEKRQEQPAEFTAWVQTGRERVAALDGERIVDIPVIEISGSSEHLIPYGKILQRSDEKGCILGEKTAERLFGSHEVEGLFVNYKGKEYVVRDVAAEPDEFLMIQAVSADTVFDRIVFARDDVHSAGATDAKRRAEQFMARYGLFMQPVERAGFARAFSIRELLPGKWSDFSGWKQNISDYREVKRQMEAIPKSVFETALVCIPNGYGM